MKDLYKVLSAIEALATIISSSVSVANVSYQEESTARFVILYLVFLALSVLGLDVYPYAKGRKTAYWENSSLHCL